MSALFSHCIRHELYGKLNPIAEVRQSAVRQRDPDILTLDEMRSILANIEPPAIRMMVAVAAASKSVKDPNNEKVEGDFPVVDTMGRLLLTASLARRSVTSQQVALQPIAVISRGLRFIKSAQGRRQPLTIHQRFVGNGLRR